MRYTRVVALVALVATAASAHAQDADFHWQKALKSGSEIKLHNLNGNITVTPGSGNTVEITGRLSSHWGRSRDTSDVYVEVHEFDGGVVACVMFRHMDGECSEDNYSIHSHGDWNDDGDEPQMDLEVHVPAGMQVAAGSVSGNVDVSGVTGELRASSVSGDVRVSGSAVSSLNAKSVSGDVEVKITSLSGNGALDAQSVSGNITLTLPAKFDADLSMRTVSGDIDSDYPITLNTRRRGRVEGKIGAGGRELDLSTVSGDVRLIASK